VNEQLDMFGNEEPLPETDALCDAYTALAVAELLGLLIDPTWREQYRKTMLKAREHYRKQRESEGDRNGARRQ